MQSKIGRTLIVAALALAAVGCNGSVSGRVEHADTGDGIEDATLLFVLQDEPGAPQLAAHSDAGGSFELTLEAGLYELISVSHPEYVWVNQAADPQYVRVNALEDSFFRVEMR